VSHVEIIKSLGTADDISLLSDKANNPEESLQLDNTEDYLFGSAAALLNIAERLEIVDIIDRHAPKREQGISIGGYIVLAAINRAIEPTSKNTFFKWFDKTILPSSFPEANSDNLSCQSFWNHMIELDQDTITKIEDDITKRIVDTYAISTDCTLFDNTNFYTYIDTSNPAELPQRGHSKEKRTDLKIVGLSLMVSPLNNIPLFHETYPGNRNDAKQFINVIDKLKKRLSSITDHSDNITLVFDKGNNSDQIIDMIDNATITKLNFIGGLRLNQFPEFPNLEKEQFIPLIGENFHGTSAFRTEKELYGQKFTVVITDNPKLKEAQIDGVQGNILKCTQALQSLQFSLKLREEGKVVKGRKPNYDSVSKNVKSILSPEHMKKIFDFTISHHAPHVSLDYHLNDEKYNTLLDKYLGKSIFFTNQHSWSNEQIVSTYRTQFHVEQAFKTMKNIKHLTFRPIRHFTDRTIRVHAFYCVLALTLCCILQLEMKNIGFDLSISSILDDLKEARQTFVYYIDKNRQNPWMESTFSKAPEAALTYINQYDLKRFARKMA
jgi:transposase